MKNNKKLCLAILSLLLLSGNASFAAKEKKYVLSSPDGTLKVEISAGNELAYQVMHGNDTILSHSNIGLVLENGTIVGKTPRITGERRRKIKGNIESPFYRFKEFVATGNELDLKLKGGFGIIFRAYNEGVAYRFYTTQSSDIIIKEEQAEFNFKEDYTAYLPYTTNDKKPMAMAYQNVYDITPLSKAQPKLAFLPVTVDCGSVKLTLLESDLEAYPGMFVQSQQGKYGLKGIDQLMDEGVAQLFVNQFNGRKIIGTVGQLQFEVIQYRLLNEYNASCRWEPVSLYKACWVESDDPAELEAFKKRKYQYMAKDREGRDVFLADSGYVLQMAQMDFKHIKFHFTSEF